MLYSCYINISLQELKTELIKMFTSENLYAIFFEVYKKHQKYSHMQLQCIPLPKEIGELAPMYFKVSKRRTSCFLLLCNNS